MLSAILIGIALRCYQLDYNLDGDEIFSVEAASGSFIHVVRVSLTDVTHPPLHNFILWAWIRLFGASEVAVRLPSVLASAAFLFSLHWLAVRISSRFTALLAVLLCAVSPFFVFYGEEARPYALAVCLAVLSTCAMVRALEEPLARWIVIYGIACAALMHTQYLGLLLLLPQFAVIAASRNPGRRRLLLAGGLGVLSILPWVTIVGLDIGQQSASRISWIGRPQIVDLVRFFLALCGYLDVDGSARILLLMYLAALAALFFPPHSVKPPAMLLLAALAVFAPVSVWSVSRFGPFSIWAPRQLIGSAAFFFLLVSVGIGACRRWIGVTLGAALVAWCLLTVPNEFPRHSKPPWREIAHMIETEPASADVLAQEGFVWQPLRYYSRREIHEAKGYSVRPEKTGRIVFLCRPAHCEELNELSRQYGLAEETAIDWVRYGATPRSRLKKYAFRTSPGPLR